MQEEKIPFIWNGSPYYTIKRESEIIIRPMRFAGKVAHIGFKENFKWHIDVTDERGCKSDIEYPEFSMSIISGTDVIAFTMGNGSIWPVPLQANIEVKTINAGSFCEFIANGVSRGLITTNI